MKIKSNGEGVRRMKKLIKALHVIKDECEKYDDITCEKCPFYKAEDEDGCLIKCEPYLWKINDSFTKALL